MNFNMQQRSRLLAETKLDFQHEFKHEKMIRSGATTPEKLTSRRRRHGRASQ